MNLGAAPLLAVFLVPEESQASWLAVKDGHMLGRMHQQSSRSLNRHLMKGTKDMRNAVGKAETLHVPLVRMSALRTYCVHLHLLK